MWNVQQLVYVPYPVRMRVRMPNDSLSGSKTV